MTDLGHGAGDALTRIRAQSPLIHHLTNAVTMSECANIVKCLGASPVMTCAGEEAAEMTSLADALVLNIGTLTVCQLEAMHTAGAAAAAKGIPVVLDVCGAGATPFRDRACADLLEALPVAIVKGNVSEIAAVAGRAASTHGVDAGEVSGDLRELVLDLGARCQGVVVLTGATDLMSDGQRIVQVSNGHPLMARVVGTGCMAASVLGSFAAVEPDLMAAAAFALAWFGLAAEHAASATASGDVWAFRGGLFSAVAGLDGTEHTTGLRLAECPQTAGGGL